MAWKDHIGLDIGSTSLKLVQLSRSGEGFKLAAIGQASRPADVTLVAKETDITPLVTAIKDLIKSSHASGNQVVIALPEAAIYTRVIRMPELNETDLAQAIKLQIEQYIPIPASDIIEKHAVISKVPKSDQNANGQIEVLLVASPIYLVNRYAELITKCGLETVAIDTEVISTARALIDGNAITVPTLIISIGATGSDLSIIKQGSLVATRFIATGGTALTRSIMTELNLDERQSEEYKRVIGLDDSKLSGGITRAVSPILEVVVAEAKRMLDSAGGSEH